MSVVTANEHAGSVSMDTRVQQLEAAMREMPQAVLETFHHFADGMYARVLPRAKGTAIVGKVHKREHFYIVAKGSVKVFSEGKTRVYSAGDLIVSKPGTKRAVLALEDSVCMTIHRTDKTDLDEIEIELVEEDDLALFDSSNKLKGPPCLGSL